ncbi:chloride channel protein [Streptomyces sp. H27-H5]|uniref:chloride channel protein n=1 Tax=Streptomyces sp. H27-H5 TaxID=2996460 RepID=UPI002271F945|nr:chloride channel protein [Streptomyces sp. H27-H5]MCY0958680.1 chloride channel protein [Streptomyces sp. H27-H5]
MNGPPGRRGCCRPSSSVVRAPVTGIVLVVEMTGATSLPPPLMTACFAATLAADRLGSTPIYDSLRLRTVWHR